MFAWNELVAIDLFISWNKLAPELNKSSRARVKLAFVLNELINLACYIQPYAQTNKFSDYDINRLQKNSQFVLIERLSDWLILEVQDG